MLSIVYTIYDMTPKLAACLVLMNPQEQLLELPMVQVQPPGAIKYCFWKALACVNKILFLD